MKGKFMEACSSMDSVKELEQIIAEKERSIEKLEKMKEKFINTRSSIDCLKELKQLITEREQNIQESEKLIQQESERMVQEAKENETRLYSDDDNELLQKAKKLRQEAFENFKNLVEMSKKDLERSKTLIQVFGICDLASKLAVESLSKFFLSSSLRVIDKDFVLKNSYYDMENDCFTGLIKNEKNNKVAYFIVNGNNHNPLFHLVALKNENEIPDYPKNEQDWISEEDCVSKLVYLLK